MTQVFYLCVLSFYAISFSTYLPKRTLMQSLKIMQTTRNREETLTASKDTLCYLSLFLSFTQLTYITQVIQKHDLL